MKKVLNIKSNVQTPKYQQIVDEIIERIQQGVLKRGDQLPTINEITGQLNVARMTVIRAYEELRERGIIAPQHGKGYFITSTDVQAHALEHTAEVVDEVLLLVIGQWRQDQT